MNDAIDGSPDKIMNSNTKTFFKAITSFNVNLEAVTQALGDDPTLLNATNHNGLVPIQVAANRGLKPLIRIIINYGADIEVTTKDGRTPVVIACQGGSLYAVHVFNECGANMDVRDSYGRTLMHHAAATGAVHLMHYLNVKCGLRHDEKDNEGYTPLHLACWNSHTETVRYLLKHKRCGDVNAASIYGSTALGMAAKNGNYTISKLIIKSTNENLLHLKDSNNFSPIDHAGFGMTQRHRDLAIYMVSWTSKQLYKSSFISLDILFWFFVLVLPGTTLYITSVLFTYIPYLLLSVPLSLVLVIVGFFSPIFHHRIPDDLNSPNPAGMGSFISGLLLTVICYFYKVLPRIWPGEAYWFLLIAIDYILIIYFFWKLERTDPGFDSVGKTLSDGTPMTIVDVAMQEPYQSMRQYPFCTSCEIVLPEISKHCKLCGRCCNGFDHHCMWLMSCIGCKNHRMFVIFLFLLFLDNTLFVRSGLSVLYSLTHTWNILELIKYGLYYEKFLSFYILCNFLTSIFVFLLSIISGQETTYFDAHGTKAFGKKRYRDLSWMTRLRNLKMFFTRSSNWYEHKIRSKTAVV